jgi:hypothetical protein
MTPAPEQGIDLARSYARLSRMLRRHLLGFCLILLFALGQHGATVHEISHLADLVPSSQQQDQAPHAPVCDKCLSYGKLSAGLVIDYFAPPQLDTGFAFDSCAVIGCACSTPSAYRARAPPRLA